MASTIIARNAGAVAAHAAVATIAAGTVVSYSYTYEGRTFTATGRVNSTEGESLHVTVLTHEEIPFLIGGGAGWNGRFCTVARRPRRAH